MAQRVAGEGEKVPTGFKVFYFERLFECSSSRDAVRRDAENEVTTWFLVVRVPVLGRLLIRTR